MTKRIGYPLTCDKCDRVGATVYADEGTIPDAEQLHTCSGTKRPTQRWLKVRV